MKIYQNIKIVIFVVCLILSIDKSAGQQNIQFTQYIFNSLAVNPAYAGYKEEWYAQATHRMQWMGIEGAPTTSQISIDGVTNETSPNVGLGLQVTSDRLGAQFANSMYVNYAYRLRLDESNTRRLSFGIGAGVTQFGLDGSKLSAVTSYDLALFGNSESNIIPDLRVGVYYTSPKWYVGLSAMDLISSNYSRGVVNWSLSDSIQNVIRKKHYYFITGGLFDLSEYIRFRPSILWKEDLSGPSLMDLTGMFVFGNKFWLGASYRTTVNMWDKNHSENQSISSLNAVCGVVQFVVDNNFRIGYSYDYMLNGLSYYQLGTHEITLGYFFRKKSKRVMSPRFF